MQTALSTKYKNPLQAMCSPKLSSTITVADRKGNFLRNTEHNTQLPMWKVISFAANYWLSKHWQISLPISLNRHSFGSKVTNYWLNNHNSSVGHRFIEKVDKTLPKEVQKTVDTISKFVLLGDWSRKQTSFIILLVGPLEEVEQWNQGMLILLIQQYIS